jgi:hypothetical protein
MVVGQLKPLRVVPLAVGCSRNKGRHGTEFRDASDGLARLGPPAPPAGPQRLFAEDRLCSAKASLPLGADGHKLSRRALLAGACALPLTRHSGLDPESMNTIATPVRTPVFMDPGLRRDDGKARDGKWQEALVRFREAEEALEALVHCRNQRVYDRALGRHSTALKRVLRAPAPDLAAAALKLELIVRHHVFEANFAEVAVASLHRDIGRFAVIPPGNRST